MLPAKRGVVPYKQSVGKDETNQPRQQTDASVNVYESAAAAAAPEPAAPAARTAAAAAAAAAAHWVTGTCSPGII